MLKTLKGVRNWSWIRRFGVKSLYDCLAANMCCSFSNLFKFLELLVSLIVYGPFVNISCT